MRLLVAISPRLNRELLALSLHGHRPEVEVMMAPPRLLDRELRRFAPHLTVHNEGVVVSERVGLICRVEMLFSDGMGAKISLDSKSWEVEDLGTEELLGLVDRAEAMISGGSVSG